jgi:hypothetical protein
MHEDAHLDSVPLTLKPIDAAVLEVRLFSALDLSVSKMVRLSTQDRNDITALAKQGLIKSGALRRRSLDAINNYVGNRGTLRSTLEFACRIVEHAERRNLRKR